MNKPVEDNKKNADKPKQDNRASVLLGDDIEIYPNEPLTHLDKGLIKAYRAFGKNNSVSELFALKCHKSLTPRHIASIKYSKVVNMNLSKLITSGKVFWSSDDQEHYFFIYENTLGYPIWTEKEQAPVLGWKSEQVLENIALPIINILMDMRDKDIIHGEIWPGNMFFHGTDTKNLQKDEAIKLGECCSAPAASQIPALYEPIERGLADSTARGNGSLADDLYSFGVSLAVILRTHDPLKGMSDEEIIEQKMEKGSYSTLIGRDRVSGSMLELLRGLLYDDPAQRWTLDDVQAWLDGRRLSPKQSPQWIKATRPLLFNGIKYTRPELLAKDMWRSPDEVVRIIENGELEQWVDRAIEDTALKVRLEQVLKDVKVMDRSAGYHERITVIVSTALYPDCPIRYRSISFIPEGFGKAFSNAYILNEDIQSYIDVLRYNFTIPAIRNKRQGTDTSNLISRLDSSRSFVSQSAIHKGLERCIYFLDSECPCLSPIVDKYYIQTPEELIEAFEDICTKGKPQSLFDRHTVSFLSVKDRKNIDPYIMELNASEPYIRSLAQLRTLATIQKREKIKKLPAIAVWAAKTIEPLYERFHDAEKREKLKAQVEKLKINGDLTKMAVLFDDPRLYSNDVSDFYQASNEYQALEKEKIKIERKLDKKSKYGHRTGHQVAAVISLFVSIIFILIMAYTEIGKG